MHNFRHREHAQASWRAPPQFCAVPEIDSTRVATLDRSTKTAALDPPSDDGASIRGWRRDVPVRNPNNSQPPDRDRYRSLALGSDDERVSLARWWIGLRIIGQRSAACHRGRQFSNGAMGRSQRRVCRVFQRCKKI